MIALLNLQALQLRDATQELRYYSMDAKGFVGLGRLENVIHYLLGDGLGWLDTRVQLCAIRTLKEVKRAAEAVPKPLHACQLGLEWNHEGKARTVWDAFLGLAPKKKQAHYWNHMERLFAPPLELGGAGSEWSAERCEVAIATYQAAAPPIDEGSIESLQRFFQELMEKVTENPSYLFYSESQWDKVRFLGRYFTTLRSIIFPAQYFPPMLNLKVNPITIVELCVKRGPILNAALEMRRRHPETWNTFLNKLVSSIVDYCPHAIDDENIDDGLLLSLHISPNSQQFEECKEIINKIRTCRTNQPHNIEYLKQQWKNLVNKLIID